jgi:ubiquinone/menaquinone biosynthesis C-methylase UbiE
MVKKEWTGERLETHIHSISMPEHLHRYSLCVEIIKGKTILDIASGEGYGTNILSNYAKFATGVDIDNQTIELAKNKYKKSNLEYKVGSAFEIPMNDNSVDVVISFETIEHHDKHDEMLKEIKRVLKTDGILIMSSPDKKNYTDIPNIINKFHVKELYFDEFKSLIKRHFLNSSYYYQKMVNGSFIFPELGNFESYDEYSGNYSEIEKMSGHFSKYNLCVASDGNIPSLNISLFDYTPQNKENNAENEINYVRNSWSYRIGNLILTPFSLIKSLISK